MSANNSLKIDLDAEVEDLVGVITQLNFSKPTWCAGRLRDNRGLHVSFSVDGYVRIGEPVTLRGKWTRDPKWGKQFKATEVVYTLPADPAGLAAWLRFYTPGIGATKSQKLVDEFGIDLIRLAAEDPQQVAACAGVELAAVVEFAEEWAKFAAKCSAITELASMGLTQRQVEVLYARFKGSAVTILREDPFMLIRQIEGFGFKTIDDIARRLGFSDSFPGRYRAAIVEAVATERDSGSTSISQGMAIALACDLLNVPEGAASATMARLAEEAATKKLLSRSVTNAEAFNVSLPAQYHHESLVWNKLRAPESCPYIATDKAEETAALYSRLERAGEPIIELDADQRQAVLAAASHRIAFITGGAGCGKTLIAKAIYRMFRDDDVNVMLCAPTGKAARRMKDVIGAEAKTIHRLLGYGPIQRADPGAVAEGFEESEKAEFVKYRISSESESGMAFNVNQHNPLPPGVVLCDEVSMVSSSLAYYLLRSLGPKTCLIGIGDPNQLPPVEAGALLRDVIEHGIAPVVRLGHCHRQAGPLKTNCAAILNGRVAPSELGEDGKPAPWMVHDGLNSPDRVIAGIRALFEKWLPLWGYSPVRDTQFLTAKHKGPLGTLFLNRVCQQLHQKALGKDGVILPDPKEDDGEKVTLYPGDKVIHTRNNYKLNVMNGTQGTVESTARGSLVVGYDDGEIEYPKEYRSEVQLAYVLTPHKAQGSEWPCAVVICPKQHTFPLQTRTWLYTACTRAQKTCVIIGDEPSIRRAAEWDQRDRRTTWLEVFAKYPEARPT